MSPSRFLVPAILIASGFADAEPKRDLYGDPLPEGAVARLGTVQRRAIGNCWLSADGKTIANLEPSGVLRYWDAVTPKLLRTDRRYEKAAPKSVQEKARVWTHLAHTSSPDGRTLAVYEGDKLEMVDLFTLEPLPMKLPPRCPLLTQIKLTRDRKLLVLQMGPPGNAFMSIWDTQSGKARLLLPPRSDVEDISPDGRFLAIAKASDPAFGKPRGMSVWDLDLGKELWETKDFPSNNACFLGDTKKLLVFGLASQDWPIFDATTGKKLREVKALEESTATRYLSVSPLGSHLVVPDGRGPRMTLLDLANDKVMSLSRDSFILNSLPQFGPDGRCIVYCNPALERLDVSTGKSLFPDLAPLGHSDGNLELSFTPNGEHLISVSADGQARVWKTAHARTVFALNSPEKPKYPGDRDPTIWQATLDGSILLELSRDRSVREYSIATGKVLASYRLASAGKNVFSTDIRVLPHENTILVQSAIASEDEALSDRVLSHWERGTGKLLRWGPPRQLVATSLGYATFFSGALSADGRWLAENNKLIDLLTGVSSPIENQYELSSDGRWLCVYDGLGTTTRIVERATRRELALLEARTSRGLSPDGRWYVQRTQEELIVWDVFAKKVAVRYSVATEYPGYCVPSLAFSHDGRFIATGHLDGTILLWPAPTKPRTGRLTDAEAQTLWRDLGNVDPAEGYPAVWRFSGDAGKLIALMRTHLSLPTPADDAEFKSLIAKLGNESFQERESATRRLQALGQPAVAPLRERLKVVTHLEERRRIERILTAMSPGLSASGDELRALRAIASLEFAPSPEGREILKEWSKRAPKPWLAYEADMALIRSKR